MSTSFSDPGQFTGQPPFPPPAKSGPGIGCFLIGCLGTLLLGVLLCAGSVWYLRNNADRWLAGFAGQIIASMVNESEIPEQEKQEVIAQVERVVDAYKARQIDQKDLERIMQQLQESPIFGLIMSYGVDQAYITPSGLPADEKQAARRTFARAMRGLLEKKIKQNDFEAALPDAVQNAADEAPAATMPPDSEPSDPSTDDISADGKLTDQQVRDFIARLKKLADDAAIPDEDFEFDIGDEVKRAVDEALQSGVKRP
jgi:hypothetical protein